MMKAIFFAALFFSTTLYGQNKNISLDDVIHYSNSFRDQYNHNIDSAYYFANQLAADPRHETFLRDIIHNSFAQSLVYSSQKNEPYKNIHITLLNKLITAPNQSLIDCAMPIYYWTQIREYKNDVGKLNELTSSFITTQLSDTEDLYKKMSARYAFLIYAIISQKSELKALSQTLFKKTFDKLQTYLQADTAVNEVASVKIKRAWYKYLFAYGNFLKAGELMSNKDTSSAGQYFKAAFSYSPNLEDKHNGAGYFYDMIFFFGKEKDTFQDDYFEYQVKYGSNKKETLNVFLQAALINPNKKKDLKTYYETNFPGQEPFDTYWTNSINTFLKEAPAISLKGLNKDLFSTAAYKGKWILLDFWGTWCSPCRKEHPDLQKFYTRIGKNKTNKLVLQTIVCHDTESKVIDYMKKLKYNFPVVMSDGLVENHYNITSYPTKILITPSGKYLLVPNPDWENFVKAYTSL